ncbi:MAG: hypothetical protein AAF713_12275 [Pseudomonadota bacterium]
MKRAPATCSVLTALALMAMTGCAVAQSSEPEVTEAEAENAARSVARYCKTLVTRMDDIITDQWATQDLQELAAVWDSLDCHRVFGVDDRVRWLVR